MMVQLMFGDYEMGLQLNAATPFLMIQVLLFNRDFLLFRF